MSPRGGGSDWDYTPTYRYEISGSGMSSGPVKPASIRFSEQEVLELMMALGVLTLAFTIAWSDLFDRTLAEIALIALSSFCAIVTAFVLHEIAHKFVAQKYGCWAEFRAWRQGLFIALLFSVFGWVFAAPGAVYIHGYLTDEQNGKVSIAGPGTNVAIGSIAMVLAVAPPLAAFKDILGTMAYINIFLAGFNLLPIPPMDGSKVWHWSKGVYLGMVVLVVALLVLVYALLPQW